jgi:hypothetical protein
MAEHASGIRVQICYAKPDLQILRDVTVPHGATLEDAIRLSDVLHVMPEINLEHCRVGIYGKLKPLDTILRDRDRIEIYRPLVADPKESRRKRAEKRDNKKAR